MKKLNLYALFLMGLCFSNANAEYLTKNCSSWGGYYQYCEFVPAGKTIQKLISVKQLSGTSCSGRYQVHTGGVSVWGGCRADFTVYLSVPAAIASVYSDSAYAYPEVQFTKPYSAIYYSDSLDGVVRYLTSSNSAGYFYGMYYTGYWPKGYHYITIYGTDLNGNYKSIGGGSVYVP